MNDPVLEEIKIEFQRLVFEFNRVPLTILVGEGDGVSTGISTEIIEKIQTLDDGDLLFSWFLLSQNPGKQQELKEDIEFHLEERGLDFIKEV